MKKIITLTLNPAVDLHCYIENFAPYHENLAHYIGKPLPSGKGVNISRALTVCGVESLAFVVLGSENGASFEKELTDFGMNVQSMTVAGRIRENMTVHTNNADETRISFSGFAADSALLKRVEDALIDRVDEDTFVTFTGRVPDGIPMEDTKRFLRSLISRGAKIVIDSKSFDLDDLIEMKPWLIKPNQEEISEYLNREVNTFEEVSRAAYELYEQGIANVMISLGSQGALLVCDEGTMIATPPTVDAISTIGAGDSSIGGFLSEAIKGASAEQMLCGAVSYGTAACLTPGTEPPRAEDVLVIRQQVNVQFL